MSNLTVKHVLWHIFLGFLVVVIAIVLFAYPLKVFGRSLVISKHESPPLESILLSPILQQDDLNIASARQALEQARAAEESARLDMLNAYTPSSPVYANSRWNNINIAESHYEQAQNEVRSIQNDLYMLQRIKESDARELKLQQEQQQFQTSQPALPYQARHH